MYKNSFLVWEHIKNHATIYLFMIILFLTGIIFGAVIVNSMGFIQKQDLFFYLERFFGQITEGVSIDKIDILWQSFTYHAKYLLLLCILGLSVIGLPLVWVLIFVKGLVIGFSVGFIVNQLGLQGLLLASLSIAPQNILVIPIYITAGSISMIFSLTLINKLFSRKNHQLLLQPLAKYSIIFVILLIVSFAAALVEAYVSNQAMQELIKSLYL
ncbi:stage II sporulation protein M [Oceanobacillus profundus]|uniref:stage II sporulation protein M n=1 Tax=Oceanobacillus profundus TaxID=372463 RepID=UPI000BA5297A|nr:stage II sporulation protein M [Oceanobacillus profundus]MCM3396563.1 stage II sporulation protein M [Oceanobacillus profundus]PAE29900.1 stage II sporulation protein M [Paenibacillus sp. 7884-2]